MVNHARRIRTMKIGDLVMVEHARAISIGVVLEEAHMEEEGINWVVHWFDDNDWTWELERDLKVIV